MYLSMSLLVVWLLATVGYVALTYRNRRERRRKERRIRELQRTVDKLSSRNGRLWYDLFQDYRSPRQVDTELTKTEF